MSAAELDFVLALIGLDRREMDAVHGVFEVLDTGEVAADGVPLLEERQRIFVTPKAYAQTITCTIGFETITCTIGFEPPPETLS